MHREDEALARAAVDALVAHAELTPKPGLPDTREPDFGALRWSAGALAPGFAAMAAAARRTGTPTRTLREELGAIGRSAERCMARAAGGGSPHHGAVFALGLLVAAAALEPGTSPAELPAVAGRIAAFPDRRAPRVPSAGASVASRFGAAGARGEAKAGFPHVRRALTALGTARRAGGREPEARLIALLTVMSTLQDTGPLHTSGPPGLRAVQAGAREVLDACGVVTDRDDGQLRAFDASLREQRLRPRGSGQLLAGALFLDGLRSGAVAPAVTSRGCGAR
ncbi:triphosphoribosyl-dephospho-CoA synthase [Streptomyces sp. NBC_01304]|uniref:triphosphoribosyl-dephospho-CoA synthase n=1 Tax=Streptomyces sp. NBC_01304 TaxID=2903818 RepID=UPI002E0F1362|nr:triphosphoribosyl-dephospho-CoA synthase [Streptomyces sp. NBC_01304]